MRIQVGEAEVALPERRMSYVVVAMGRPSPHNSPHVGVLDLPLVGGLVEHPPGAGILGRVRDDQAQIRVEPLQDRIVGPGQKGTARPGPAPDRQPRCSFRRL